MGECHGDILFFEDDVGSLDAAFEKHVWHDLPSDKFAHVEASHRRVFLVQDGVVKQLEGEPEAYQYVLDFFERVARRDTTLLFRANGSSVSDLVEEESTRREIERFNIYLNEHTASKAVVVWQTRQMGVGEFMRMIRERALLPANRMLVTSFDLEPSDKIREEYPFEVSETLEFHDDTGVILKPELRADKLVNAKSLQAVLKQLEAIYTESSDELVQSALRARSGTTQALVDFIPTFGEEPAHAPSDVLSWSDTEWLRSIDGSWDSLFIERRDDIEPEDEDEGREERGEEIQYDFSAEKDGEVDE